MFRNASLYIFPVRRLLQRFQSSFLTACMGPLRRFIDFWDKLNCTYLVFSKLELLDLFIELILEFAKIFIEHFGSRSRQVSVSSKLNVQTFVDDSAALSYFYSLIYYIYRFNTSSSRDERSANRMLLAIARWYEDDLKCKNNSSMFPWIWESWKRTGRPNFLSSREPYEEIMIAFHVFKDCWTVRKSVTSNYIGGLLSWYSMIPSKSPQCIYLYILGLVDLVLLLLKHLGICRMYLSNSILEERYTDTGICRVGSPSWTAGISIVHKQLRNVQEMMLKQLWYRLLR